MSQLMWKYENSVLDEVIPDLIRLETEVMPSFRALGRLVSPPKLIQYDQWGRRIDDLQTSEGWRGLKAAVQREGLPGIFYERKYGAYSRVWGFAKVLILSGDAFEVFCPISMTDGAARVIELSGTPAMKRDIFPRLISRDPSVAFTAGQWMTERPGGSDVSQTETTATPLPSGTSGKGNALGPQYTLNGFKWFSSATDSNISVALARTGAPADGSRSLSLFLVPLRLPLPPISPASPNSLTPPPPTSTSNGIYIHRLKSKIGTHILPTAELSLQNVESYLIGPLNQGIKTILPVLGITRVWSAMGIVAGIRKCLAIATSYATLRHIEGGRRLLRDTPVHVSHLAQINVTYRALACFAFGVVGLLGRVECGVEEEGKGEGGRLRVLTGVVKAFVAEKGCAAMEDAMTALGGAGYMEENGIGMAIRDGLVEKIWEGTTTVLAVDLARTMTDPSIMTSFISWAESVISQCPTSIPISLQTPLEVIQKGLKALSTAYKAPVPVLMPRPALFLVGYVASSVFLLEHALGAQDGGEDAVQIGGEDASQNREDASHNGEDAVERDRQVDLEVFNRWVLEGGFVAAIEDVVRTGKQGDARARVLSDSGIVFGTGAGAGVEFVGSKL